MTEMLYGIEIDSDKFKWKDDAGAQVFDKYADLFPGMRDEYKEYCSDTEADPEDPDTKSEFLDDTEWECNGSFITGIDEIVTAVINLKEFEGRNIFVRVDGCIGVTAYIPETSSDWERYPTQEDIRRIIDEYVTPLIKRPVKAGLYTVDWDA